MGKFDLQVTDDEEAMLLSLRSKWQAFRITMTESDKMLNKSKQSMKQDVENALDNLISDADEQRKVANEKLPFGDDMSPTDAMAKIQEFREKTAKERQNQADLRPGLEIF